MKGIEGLALRYVLIILVAALVIGVAYTVVSTFTDIVTEQGGTLAGMTVKGFSKVNNQTCASFGCTWNETTKECVC